jgi:hypothetical protein
VWKQSEKGEQQAQHHTKFMYGTLGFILLDHIFPGSTREAKGEREQEKLRTPANLNTCLLHQLEMPF